MPTHRITLVLILSMAASYLHGAATDWPAYGNDLGSSKYADLDQINASNVAKPEIAWQWQSPDNALVKADPKKTPWGFKSTPLKVGNVLYTSTTGARRRHQRGNGRNYLGIRYPHLRRWSPDQPWIQPSRRCLTGRIAGAGHASSCLPTMPTCGRWMRQPANLFETLATLAVWI